MLAGKAQPNTDILLFDLQYKNGKVILSNPLNITNRKGYDNQPYFHPDNPVMYYSSADSSGRTDIMFFDYAKGETGRFTTTPEKEFSPTVTPDKQFISCIIQRDNSAQDLGKYPINGGDAKILISDLIVGYHAWADPERVLIFVLPQPFTLHLVDLKSGSDIVVADSIGRSLHKIPGKTAISFTQRTSGNEWLIQQLDLHTLEVSSIIKSLHEIEHDFTWMPDGTLLMSYESRVFFSRPFENQEWNEAEIITPLALNIITRLAVSPDGNKVALVVNETP
jgi:hypothetical protein